MRHKVRTNYFIPTVIKGNTFLYQERAFFRRKLWIRKIKASWQLSWAVGILVYNTDYRTRNWAQLVFKRKRELFIKDPKTEWLQWFFQIRQNKWLLLLSHRAFLMISTMTKKGLLNTGGRKGRRPTLGLPEENKVSIIKNRDWQMFPVKDLVINILGFACHIWSVSYF